MAKIGIPKETKQEISKIIDDFNHRNFHDYNGDFAIFKWSREAYDPDEWMFPGIEFVDGTIEGALKAGLIAYPV